VRACKRINGVVIKRGWCPSRLRVASGTLRWELGRCVVRIGRSRVIRIVATIAGIRRIGIIAVVTSVAIVGNRHVRAYEWVNRIVIKSRWRPGGLCVASGALRWELGRCVVRIGRSRVIRIVATIAGIWGICIVTVVTSVAIIGNGHVRAYEWINRIVVKRRWRPSRFAVASSAIRGELSCGVVRCCGGSVVTVVTGVAGIWRCIVIAVVAGRAIAGNGRVRAVQGVIIIVNREGRWFPTRCGGVAHRTIRWDS
jgi:hypothetical protein